MERFLLVSLMIAAVCGCGPNRRIMEEAKEKETSRNAVIENSAPLAEETSFEKDLQAMRNADFKFILVFRRKDGQPMTPEDKALIGTNTGMQANRRRVSDDGRAVIIGGNFPFATKPMSELTAKFNMENYSKPDSGPLTSDELNPAPAGEKKIKEPVREDNGRR